MPVVSEWHDRFIHQAGWSAEIRRFLTADLQLEPRARLLDVGCGTGALFPSIKQRYPYSQLHGLDLNYRYLAFAPEGEAALCLGNALSLPYPAETFDLVYCHYLLLWLQKPADALTEMIRVAKPGSFVFAFAEPDYGGRVDFPLELVQLGQLQQQALTEQGADTLLGRKLASLLSNSGLVDLQVGVLGGQWFFPTESATDETEWWMLQQDLADMMSTADLQHYLDIDRQARVTGERVLYVPTFYGRGRKPY